VDDVDVIETDEHGRNTFDTLEPLLGIEPGHRCGPIDEALENDPVDLGWRARRQDRLLDEAGRPRDDGAGLLLPTGEGIGAFRSHTRLRHDGDRTTGRAFCSASALRAVHG